MTRTRLAVALLAISTCAAVALGQNADENTAGPTKNDYRLKVIEPTDGAAITGPTVRVVVDTTVPEQVGGQTLGPNIMPRPLVDVWLDGTRRGTMENSQNVIELDNVSPGPHKLALVAKNKSNEIIDRKEINFTSSGSVVKDANSGGTTPPQSSAYMQENGSNGTASSYGTSSTMTTRSDSSIAGPTTSKSTSTYTPPTTSTYSSPQTSSSSSMSTAENHTRPRMPETASNDGALLLAGGALLLGSYLIRRKAA